MTTLEQRLNDLDARLLEVLAEVREIREAIAELMVRIEPAVRGAAWVDNVLRYQVSRSEDEPDEPPRPTKPPLLCRWLGHQRGPRMGLMVTCNRCGEIYRLGRGV
jgi:hypothetical protein